MNQLTLFPEPVIVAVEPPKPVFAKRSIYSELSIHEKINVKYNHGFIMNFLRAGVRQKHGWDNYPFDRDTQKQIAGLGGNIPTNQVHEKYSVSTTMWLEMGFIHGSSSLHAQYGKPITWEIIQANRRAKEKDKLTKQKQIKIS